MRSLAIGAVLLGMGAVGSACQAPSPSGAGAATSSAAPSTTTPMASASGAASAVKISPNAATTGGIPAEKVAKEVNPDGRAPYVGPTGTLRGVVRVDGDEPPAQDFRFPDGCSAASATYSKLFRVGQDKTLGDVLVAVTGYDGYVPPAKPAVQLTIQDCAFSTRTVAVTYGQTIDIRNRDGRLSYLPMLEGAHAAATLVAIPGGEPVKLFAPEPKRYRLVDQMGRNFMVADVLVLRYATTSVTDLGGRYEIAGIPVGKVKVSAMLPAAKMKAVNQDFEVKAGDNTLDLTIAFDASKDAP